MIENELRHKYEFARTTLRSSALWLGRGRWSCSVGLRRSCRLRRTLRPRILQVSPYPFLLLAHKLPLPIQLSPRLPVRAAELELRTRHDPVAVRDLLLGPAHLVHAPADAVVGRAGEDARERAGPGGE